MAMLPVLSAVILIAGLAAPWRPCAALSETVCDNVASTWVSDSPQLTGQFPFYNLLFFCEGNLNLGSRHVDACTEYGSYCGQSAADQFCQFVGFEGASPGAFTTETADAPTRSMSGEWCVEEGRYEDLGYLNRTQLESLNSTISGPRCKRLESVVCFTSRERLASNNKDLHDLSHAPAQSPSDSSDSVTPTPDATAEVSTSSIPDGATGLPSNTATGGRRRLQTRSL